MIPKSEFKGIEGKGISLIVADPKKHWEVTTSALGYLLQDHSKKGIYVGVTSSCDDLREHLRGQRVPDADLFVIDTIGKSAGANHMRQENCIMLDAPSNLTDIAIAIDKHVHGRDFLFLDSLPTMFLYNPPQSVAKFIHFLTVKLKSLNIGAIIISLSKYSEEEIQNLVLQFMDNVIEVK